MRNIKTVLVLGTAMLGLSLSACATKEYVDKEVLRVDSNVQSTQSQLSSTQGDLSKTQADVASAQSMLSAQDARINGVDQTAKDALQRAMAAGKLAEGKLLYTMVLSDDGVKFNSSHAELTPEAQARLADLVNKLKADNKAVYLEVQGHTDSAGDAKYNEKLGLERAEAVRKYLSQQGLPLSRIGTISYGEEMPVAPNNNKQGRAQNRRVVVVVLS